MILGHNKSLPIGWQWYKAGDVIDVRDGTHDSPKYQATGIPLVTSKNLVNGAIDFSTCTFISDIDHAAISKRSAVNDGDILYAMIGTIGNPVIVKKEFEFSIKNVALFKFDNDEVFNRFVYHYLQSNLVERQFSKNARGGTQKFVSLGNIRDLLIPLPPLKEQKRIAAILDKADTIRRKRQHAIDHTEQLLRSVFLDMFGDPVANPKGWDKVKLERLCNICRGGSPRPIQDYLGGTIPWIKIGDATKGDDIYIYSTKEKIFETGLSKTRLLQPGSLIFANCGVSLGFARILKIAGCIHDGWLAFEIKDGSLNQLFLLKALNQITKHFQDIAPDGTQPNLNTAIMKDFELILPPIDLQENFEDAVQKIRLMKENYDKACGLADNSFNSLIQQAFNGELSKQSKAA